MSTFAASTILKPSSRKSSRCRAAKSQAVSSWRKAKRLGVMSEGSFCQLSRILPKVSFVPFAAGHSPRTNLHAIAAMAQPSQTKACLSSECQQAIWEPNVAESPALAETILITHITLDRLSWISLQHPTG